MRRAIEREVARGGQVFFVHNRVETIDDVAERLAALVPGARFVTAHGQMPERALEEVMRGFLAGEADVLVTTTIVESGLDVATANTLIVDRADAMGLSQLYQLRGRIGRSTEQAYSYLFAPLGATPESQKRLEALMDFTELGSGFAVAMRDLEIRGAGNLLGSEQSGHIAAVGFEMYLRLLEEAVALARGDKSERREERPVIVELPLDAYIPPGYVMDEIERVDLYRRASGLGSTAEVEDLAEEMTDRFGALPGPGTEPARPLAGEAPRPRHRRNLGLLPLRVLEHLRRPAGSAAPAVLRKATGGTVTTREGRITVRALGGDIEPLALAEDALGGSRRTPAP